MFNIVFENMLASFLTCTPSVLSHNTITQLKVHKHEIFFVTFFAETETIGSQGPVTRDF